MIDNFCLKGYNFFSKVQFKKQLYLQEPSNFCTFLKNVFTITETILTPLKYIQNLKKPNLGFWSFRGYAKNVNLDFI
jgi:hypothetical protein